MTKCFFVTDLHGHIDRYEKLAAEIRSAPPAAVFLGGDLLPHVSGALAATGRYVEDFAHDYLIFLFAGLKKQLGKQYPRVFVILGNDDARIEEDAFIEAADDGLWDYVHRGHAKLGDYDIYGYACVPPTPFQLKDWERFDVSRHIDPGCVSPEEGVRSVAVPERDAKYRTIAEDLEALAGENELSRAVILFHTPPYKTKLDRAALDGQMIDYVPLDVHVGSIAVLRFIENRQPLLTLHGHVHESARLTGAWQERIGDTLCLSAAHDGPELALVTFELDNLTNIERRLL